MVLQLRSIIGLLQHIVIFLIWLWLVVTANRMRRITELFPDQQRAATFTRSGLTNV